MVLSFTTKIYPPVLCFHKNLPVNVNNSHSLNWSLGTLTTGDWWLVTVVPKKQFCPSEPRKYLLVSYTRTQKKRPITGL